MTDADPDALFEGDDAARPATSWRRRRRWARRPAPPGCRARAQEEASVAAADSEPVAATGPGCERGPEDRGRRASGAAAPAGPRSAAKTAAAERPPAPTGDGPGFHIQVLATSDREKAEALVARLVDADFKAFIVPSNEGGRTMYRVRVGPFEDRAIAAGKAEELETRWGLDSWISPGAP